jgi:hypothetical protein
MTLTLEKQAFSRIPIPLAGGWCGGDNVARSGRGNTGEG